MCEWCGEELTFQIILNTPYHGETRWWKLPVFKIFLFGKLVRARRMIDRAISNL